MYILEFLLLIENISYEVLSNVYFIVYIVYIIVGFVWIDVRYIEVKIELKFIVIYFFI